ncbi:MAG: MFS transporter [Thermoplasmata archaeon YP2-bin.285]|uniref:MFS transporter n=1 Tax=Candidatus Sysuiplasma superficiale TaxID=2823368 RepID=A0A8J7YKI4_9ARCH|nr:MFS transporter [Candidatus Sysuiplasma superficiale]
MNLGKPDLSGFMISVSRSMRSFVLTLLSFSSPYFLVSHSVSYFNVGMIILAGSAASTIYVYVLPVLRIRIIRRVLLSWFLFSFATVTAAVTLTVAGFIFAVVAGGISLSGKDMSPNQPVEQYVIGSLFTSSREKNLHFSFYNFLSYAGNTAGALFVVLYPGVTFRLIFDVCAFLAVASVFPYMLVKFPEHSTHRRGTPKLDREARSSRNRLAALFAADAFGGGFVSTSMLALWFLAVFSVPIRQSGLIFAFVNILSGISIIASGRLSMKIGTIRTMVWTHLISNIFLILMPLFHILVLSELFLFARQATSQMDVSPRDTFVNTVFSPEVRPRTNSQFLAVRNVSTIPSPALGGAIIQAVPDLLPFSAGIIKSAYDVTLYVLFRENKI